MPQATARRDSPPPHKLLTAADVAMLPSDLPSGRVRYELDNGKLLSLFHVTGSNAQGPKPDEAAKQPARS